MTSAVGFTGTSVSALYQILAEKDQPDGYVGLDANGKIPVQYLPDEIPKDFTDVEIKTNKNQPNGYPGLDAGGQLLASVIPAGSYILSADKGAVNGVAPLDGTGTIYFTDLPVGTTSTSVAVGNHTHTGEFVREDQRNLPNGFAGLNSSSKIDINNIPAGTTSTTVAVGNHAHSGQFEPVINPKRTAFNVDFGSSAGQASEGNHKHDGGDITTGKIAFARLPTGSVASTVAIGNHNHDLDYVRFSGLSSFTPLLSNRADYTEIGTSYATQVGRHCVTGPICTFVILLRPTSITEASTTNLAITGLPFDEDSGTWTPVNFLITSWNPPADFLYWFCYVKSPSHVEILYVSSLGNTVPLPVSSLGTNSEIRVFGTYFI